MTSPAMPPVYAISLARAQERRANIKRRLDALGVAYEIVDAVDGAALDLSQYAHRLKQNKCRARHGYELTRNEIGCFLSHYNLWRRVADGDDECALIVEDDAVWDDDFADVICAIAQCEWHWEVVNLGMARHKINRTLCELPGGRKLVRCRRQVSTTTAYLISRSGADKLLEYCEEIRAPVDSMYLEYWKNGVAYYCVKPVPARQSGEESVIDYKERSLVKHTVTERMLIWLWRKSDLVRQHLFCLTNQPSKRRYPN